MRGNISTRIIISHIIDTPIIIDINKICDIFFNKEKNVLIELLIIGGAALLGGAAMTTKKKNEKNNKNRADRQIEKELKKHLNVQH